MQLAVVPRHRVRDVHRLQAGVRQFAVLLDDLRHDAAVVLPKAAADDAHTGRKSVDQRSQARAELETALAYYYDGIDAEKALVHGERAVRVWRTLPKSTYRLVNALAGQAMFNVDTGHFAAAEASAAEALSRGEPLF